MDISKGTIMVSVRSGGLKTRLISFKKLLFFVIKESKRVVVMIGVKLRIINSIEVTDSKSTFGGV